MIVKLILVDITCFFCFFFFEVAQSIRYVSHNPTRDGSQLEPMASNDVIMEQNPPSLEADPKYGGFTRFEIELEVCNATHVLPTAAQSSLLFCLDLHVRHC